MKKALAIVAALIISVSAYAQIVHPVKWGYVAKRTSATEAIVIFKATIQPTWHIYSLHVKNGPIPTSFTFAPSKDYILVDKPIEPKPLAKYDKNFKTNLTYFENAVIFQQKIKLKSANAITIKGQFEYMVCNNIKCLPPEDVNFTIPLGK